MSTQPEKSPASKTPETDKKTAPNLPAEALSRTESKASQLFRSFLRWAGLGVVVFGLGALTAIFLFYVPKADELKLAEQDLATANAKINELHAEIATLETQIAELTPLEETNQSLKTELDQVFLHLHLIVALKDVRSAQFALAQENTPHAKNALEETADTLTTMQDLLATDQATELNALLSRLELAQGEIESNPFAAQSDLEVLAVRLIELEEAWFSAP
ncbi:MAG: hypothetical protein HUU38_26055 [Anaerolineales bacterium]|nr:hypothetical protein [Anaerolineales bacterium]